MARFQDGNKPLRIEGVATPTSDTDAVNREYVTNLGNTDTLVTVGTVSPVSSINGDGQFRLLNSDGDDLASSDNLDTSRSMIVRGSNDQVKAILARMVNGSIFKLQGGSSILIAVLSANPTFNSSAQEYTFTFTQGRILGTSGTLGTNDYTLCLKPATTDLIRASSIPNGTITMDHLNITNEGTAGQVLSLHETGGGSATWINRSTGTNFLVHEQTVQTDDIAQDDYLVYSDESATDNPNRRLSVDSFVTQGVKPVLDGVYEPKIPHATEPLATLPTGNLDTGSRAQNTGTIRTSTNINSTTPSWGFYDAVDFATFPTLTETYTASNPSAWSGFFSGTRSHAAFNFQGSSVPLSTLQSLINGNVGNENIYLMGYVDAANWGIWKVNGGVAEEGNIIYFATHTPTLVTFNGNPGTGNIRWLLNLTSAGALVATTEVNNDGTRVYGSNSEWVQVTTNAIADDAITAAKLDSTTTNGFTALTVDNGGLSQNSEGKFQLSAAFQNSARVLALDMGYVYRPMANQYNLAGVNGSCFFSTNSTSTDVATLISESSITNWSDVRSIVISRNSNDSPSRSIAGLVNLLDTGTIIEVRETQSSDYAVWTITDVTFVGGNANLATHSVIFRVQATVADSNMNDDYGNDIFIGLRESSGTPTTSANTGYSIVVHGEDRVKDGRLIMDQSLKVSSINATGTPSATTYLRGDGSWSTVSGGGGSSFESSTVDNSFSINYETGTLSAGQFQLRTGGGGLKGNSGTFSDARILDIRPSAGEMSEAVGRLVAGSLVYVRVDDDNYWLGALSATPTLSNSIYRCSVSNDTLISARGNLPSSADGASLRIVFREGGLNHAFVPSAEVIGGTSIAVLENGSGGNTTTETINFQGFADLTANLSGDTSTIWSRDRGQYAANQDYPQGSFVTHNNKLFEKTSSGTLTNSASIGDNTDLGNTDWTIRIGDIFTANEAGFVPASADSVIPNWDLINADTTLKTAHLAYDATTDYTTRGFHVYHAGAVVTTLPTTWATFASNPGSSIVDDGIRFDVDNWSSTVRNALNANNVAANQTVTFVVWADHNNWAIITYTEQPDSTSVFNFTALSGNGDVSMTSERNGTATRVVVLAQKGMPQPQMQFALPFNASTGAPLTNSLHVFATSSNSVLTGDGTFKTEVSVNLQDPKQLVALLETQIADNRFYNSSGDITRIPKTLDYNGVSQQYTEVRNYNTDGDITSKQWYYGNFGESETLKATHLVATETRSYDSSGNRTTTTIT